MYYAGRTVRDKEYDIGLSDGALQLFEYEDCYVIAFRCLKSARVNYGKVLPFPVYIGIEPVTRCAAGGFNYGFP